MVENRPFVTFLSHAVLLLGLLIIAFPLWMTFVASTHDQSTMLRSPVPLLPGPHLIENYRQVLFEGFGRGFGGAPIWIIMMNSMVMVQTSTLMMRDIQKAPTLRMSAAPAIMR